MHPEVREIVSHLKIDCPNCPDNCCYSKYNPYQTTFHPILDSRAERLVPKELVELVDNIPMMKTIEGRCAALDTETNRCTVYEDASIMCGLFPFQLLPWAKRGTYDQKWFGGIITHLEQGYCANMRNLDELDPELIKELVQKAAKIFRSDPVLVERVERLYREFPKLAEANYVF